MDLMMPEMDGLTTIRHLRADPVLQSLPVIALTAKAMPDDRERCLEAGADDYIAKPIDVDRLVSLCRVWVRK
jgi:CheY-like chemotaxis protein